MTDWLAALRARRPVRRAEWFATGWIRQRLLVFGWMRIPARSALVRVVLVDQMVPE